MKHALERLGVIPYLLLGGSLFVLGLLTADNIVNNYWPFDVSRLDLVRATAMDTVDAAALLEAANEQILLAFLASLMAATTGFMLPIIYYANDRFGPPDSAPAFLIVVRQSMWIGIWLGFCLWLQMNRSLGVAVAGLVAAVMIMFEILLQVRMRASTISATGSSLNF